MIRNERLEVLGVADRFLVEDRCFFADQGLLRQDVESGLNRTTYRYTEIFFAAMILRHQQWRQKRPFKLVEADD